MKHPYFHRAVMQAYDQLIPAGEQPGYFLYFTLNPASIDVNIHPTKTEIKFEDEQPIWQILMAAVRETLAKSSAIPMIEFEEEHVPQIPVYNPTRAPQVQQPPHVQVHSNYNPFDVQTSRTDTMDWDKMYQNFEAERAQVEIAPESSFPPGSGDGGRESAVGSGRKSFV